jgi:hypothetical protein
MNADCSGVTACCAGRLNFPSNLKTAKGLIVYIMARLAGGFDDFEDKTAFRLLHWNVIVLSQVKFRYHMK